LPPLLKDLVRNVTSFEIELAGKVTIEVVTRSYRTVRGRSVAVALLDELAFWRDDDSANPDTAVLNAIVASQATFGDDAMIIAASSPYAKIGALWDAFKRYHGQDDPHNLVWQAGTRVMNPTISEEFIAREFERDPVSAEAEYNANFRSDIAEFISLEVLESCVATGIFEIAPLSGVKYVAFVDPSGGSSDAFALAIAHRESSGTIVLDCLRETRAPFQPAAITEDYCRTLKSYGIGTVHGDRYAGQWPAEQFLKCKIEYRPSERVKSDLYRDMLPLLNSGKVQLLDNRRLINQLHGLERRTARGGRDSIDHSTGRHDDAANAAAGAIVLASAYTVPMTWHAPIVGPSKASHAAEYGLAILNNSGPGIPGYGYGGSAPPGGWPAGSPQAGVTAGIGWLRKSN
jgi:hypothetical protein